MCEASRTSRGEVDDFAHWLKSLNSLLTRWINGSHKKKNKWASLFNFCSSFFIWLCLLKKFSALPLAATGSGLTMSSHQPACCLWMFQLEWSHPLWTFIIPPVQFCPGGTWRFACLLSWEQQKCCHGPRAKDWRHNHDRCTFWQSNAIKKYTVMCVESVF